MRNQKNGSCSAVKRGLCALLSASLFSCDSGMIRDLDGQAADASNDAGTGSDSGFAEFTPMYNLNLEGYSLGRSPIYTNNRNFIEQDPLGGGGQVLRCEILQDVGNGPYNIGINVNLSNDTAFTSLGNGDEYWFRADVFFPLGFDISSARAGSSNRKFLRVDTEFVTNSPGKFDFLFPAGNNWTGYAVGSETLPTEFSSFSYDSPVTFQGAWHRWEVHVVLAEAGAVRVFHNKTLVYENTNFKSIDGPGVTLKDNIRVFSYWNSGSPVTQSAYIDNVTFAVSTQGRPPDRDMSDTYDIIGDWTGAERIP